MLDPSSVAELSQCPERRWQELETRKGGTRPPGVRGWHPWSSDATHTIRPHFHVRHSHRQ